MTEISCDVAPIGVETIVSIAESIIKSLAILVAGLWSLYLFRVLKRRTRAEETLKSMQIEREKAELSSRKITAEIQKLNLEAKKQAVIDIVVTASQVFLPDDLCPDSSSRYISVLVTIHNKGTRNTRLSYKKRLPLIVTPIQTTENGEITYGISQKYPARQSSNPSKHTPAVIVRAGGSVEHIFFLRVPTPGAYMVSFIASLSSEEQEIATEAGARYGASWAGKTLVSIK